MRTEFRLADRNGKTLCSPAGLHFAELVSEGRLLCVVYVGAQGEARVLTPGDPLFDQYHRFHRRTQAPPHEEIPA